MSSDQAGAGDPVEEIGPQASVPGKTPGRDRGIGDGYTGRSAQLAVAAELLRRQINVAIPEVDAGIDLLAFREGDPAVARVQVKACGVPQEYANDSGFSAKFSLPLKQLLLEDTPLVYALAVFRTGRWSEFVVVSRERIQGYLSTPERFGHFRKNQSDLELTIEFRERVKCSGRDLTDCRNAWDTLLAVAAFRGQPIQPGLSVENPIAGASAAGGVDA